MDAPGTPSSSGFQIPQFILDDLCSRFIINIPEEERQDLIRIFFQIELAHWFYLDFYCQENPDLRACGIKDFSAQIFNHCPTLIDHADNVENILGSWREYKMAVPTYGAILLDPSLQYVLLVQGFWARANWGFPKGKVNENELAHDCAIREVLEETGFDVSSLLDQEEYIEYKINEQLSRLYIVPDVPLDTQFAPRTRKEIKSWKWFLVDHLPVHKKDPSCRENLDLAPNAFFMVIPFVRQIRRWITRQQGNSESELDSSFRGQRARSASGAGGDGADKPRLKPTQLFCGGVRQAELHGKHQHKGKGRSVSTSPSAASKVQKNRRMSSPKKPVTIMKRGEGAGKAGTPRKSSSHASLPDYGDSQQGRHKSRKEEFTCQAWQNFHLDFNAVLACI